MRLFLAFAAIFTFVVACSNANSKSSTTTEAIAATSPDAPDGEKLYKQYCVICHGVYGDMGTNGAFNLTTSTLSDEERIAVITNGREGTQMVGFKSTLDEAKIKAVAAYIVKLKK